MTIAKKKKTQDGIYFTGISSDNEVTGSQYYIRFGDKQILLECGLYQNNDYMESYQVNSQPFKFNPAELDYVFLGHQHIDHAGNLPKLIKEGFTGKIIATEATARISEALLRNCAFILADEARVLSKRYQRDYTPIYTNDEVTATLDHLYIYDDYDTEYILDENVSFKWIRNSHCIGAAQLLLTLHDESRCKRVLYTSDIGSLSPKNHFVGVTEIPTDFSDVTIMESTYGNRKRMSKKARAFDVDHLRVAVNTVTERGGTIILPCFSFHRTQEILVTLYEIFGKSDKFNIPVVIDSMLSCEICDIYDSILTGEDKTLWNNARSWKNVRFIKDKTESQMCAADTSPKIVLSSSGFCTNGRVLRYLSKYLPDINSMVIFSGYSGGDPSYLSYRIKNYKDYKTIKISGEPVENKADCITLSSFSSHANHDELVKFGSNLKTNKLILVHGDEDAKNDLRNDLVHAISKNNKTYKVLCSSKDMFCKL